jgi:AraC family transcriptional regulator
MADRGLLQLLGHVSAHLDEELGLAALARWTRRSSFALHRRVTSALGETPHQLVERLRLERAAARLVSGEAASILTVALDAGFQSHEVFTRAFRRRFGTSPARYRARGLHHPAGAAEHVAVTRGVGACVGVFRIESTAPRNEIMSYDVTRTELPPRPALFVRRKTKAADIAKTLAESFGQVFAHCQRAGLALAGPPFCRYAAWGPLLTLEAGFPLASAAPGDGAIEAGVLHGGVVAKVTHAGAYDSLGEAHAALETWVDGQGLTKAGAPWESYLTDPGETPDPKDWRTEVFLPIEP